MKCPVKVISNLTIMCFIETFGDGCMVGSTISVTMMTELILGAFSSYIHDAICSLFIICKKSGV